MLEACDVVASPSSLLCSSAAILLQLVYVWIFLQIINILKQ